MRACVRVRVRACECGMTSLADAYHCACLGLFFPLYLKWEEQVCELRLCVRVSGGGNGLSVCLYICPVCLAVCPLFI